MSSANRDYGREGQALVRRQPLQDHTLTFSAENIRVERTGVHARLSVCMDGAVLAWSNFNVERDEDRVRLSNSAFQHLNGLSGEYPKAYLKNDLDLFCAGLWDAKMSETMPVLMAGTLEPHPPTFLLKPFVLTEGGTIIFAPPGRGKSYTLMLMAVSVDAGVSALWPVKQAPVLFINLERGAASVADRLGNVNAVLGLERERPLATINARGRSLTDVAASAERFIGEHESACVFVDSISRAGAGDLNANVAVNGIIDQLNRMCPAWVGLAHTPRNDESHLYGGVHFEAGADVVVQLVSEQEEGGPLGLGLQITKQNDIGKVPMWVGALEFCEMGLLEARRAKAGEFAEVERARRMTLREGVRQHLLDVGAQDATEIAEATGFSRENISRMLNDPNAGFVKSGRSGHKVLYGVANG